MRPSHFRKNTSFFHLNVHIKTTGYFKNLDWIYLQRTVYNLGLKYQIELQALVMMDTHFHLLIESFNHQENFFCHDLETQLQTLAEQRAHCEPIQNLAQYLVVCKYIYNNPVQANICLHVEDYPFSSIQFLLGFAVSHCLISDKLGLIQNPQRILSWLNSDSEFKVSKLNLQKHFES